MCDHSIFQSNVQLGLDFLSPESVGDAVRLAEEIRCLPNEHEAKLQVLEVRREELHLSIKFLFCCHLPVPPYFVLLKCLCLKKYLCWHFGVDVSSMLLGHLCRLGRYLFMQQVQPSKKFKNLYLTQSMQISDLSWQLH